MLLHYVIIQLLCLVVFFKFDASYFLACKADIALVVDSSASIRRRNNPNVDNWEIIRKFLEEFVSRLDIGQDEIRVAATLFSNEAVLAFHLDQYDDQEEVLDHVMTLPYLVGLNIVINS